MSYFKKTVASVLLASVLCFPISFDKAFAADTPTTDSVINTTTAVAVKQKSISVNGYGVVKVMPDMATISFGVVTEAVNSKDALNENSIQMDKVLKAIKQVGISEKDIRTTGFYIYPNYSYSEKNRNEIVSYRVNNSVTVEVKDLDMLSNVIDAATDAGANASNGIQFSVFDSEQYYYEALAIAVTSAKNKAHVIAKAINASITDPVTVSETSSNYSGTFRTSASYDKGAIMEAEGVSVPVSAGEIEISAQVNVLYKY